jgi:hypothetical protein
LKEKREHATTQEEKTRIRAELAAVRNMILLNIKHNDDQIRETTLQSTNYESCPTSNGIYVHNY